jgi:hypothetical protein
MLPYPIFPNSSAFGAFPQFPTYSISIPNLADLPSYIYSVTTYYADVLNVPYKNPPTIATWTIHVPELTGMLTWIANVFLWLAGWTGAIFAYGVEYVAAIAANGILYLIGICAGLISSIIQTMVAMTAPLGIFAIPVDTLILGLLIVAIVLGIFGMIKAAQHITVA